MQNEGKPKELSEPSVQSPPAIPLLAEPSYMQSLVQSGTHLSLSSVSSHPIPGEVTMAEKKEGKSQRLELESMREQTFPQWPARPLFPSLLPSASLLNHIQNTPVVLRPSSLNGVSLSF